MTSMRIQCTDCDNMILPETAEANHGLCGQCAKLPASLRSEQRVFKEQLARGSLFVPDELELASASEPLELRDQMDWLPDPANSSGKLGSAIQILERAAGEARGNVFLLSTRGARLNLSFTAQLAVCEYHDQEEGTFLYAFTRANLRQQVAAVDHVVQACPCCGVGLLWFPSRFHMPRQGGFDLMTAILQKQPMPDVQWLEIGDITLTARGAG